MQKVFCKKTASQIEHESDLGYGKDWALFNNEFHRVLTKLAFFLYGLFLVSHSVEKEIETRTPACRVRDADRGKHTRIVPTLPDKARKIVPGMVDLILYCDLETATDEEGKTSYRRVMRTTNSKLQKSAEGDMGTPRRLI